jgi:tRNA(Ile2) C34 agmatinyltransferase TiaS
MYKVRCISARDFDSDEDFIDENLDPKDFVHCTLCGGEGVPLGQLGRRVHYRCRQCGYNFGNAAAQ